MAIVQYTVVRQVIINSNARSITVLLHQTLCIIANVGNVSTRLNKRGIHSGFSMMQHSISLGTSKVQLLLNKHENANGVSMKTSMPEGDCVMTT